MLETPLDLQSRQYVHLVHDDGAVDRWGIGLTVLCDTSLAPQSLVRVAVQPEWYVRMRIVVQCEWPRFAKGQRSAHSTAGHHGPQPCNGSMGWFRWGCCWLHTLEPGVAT